MASIPCSSRHSVTYIKDIQDLFKNQATNPLVTFTSQPTTTATTTLKYFNRRVTQRLHCYRSMKRQWQEVATSVQHNPSLSPTCESPIPLQDILPITQNTTKNLTVPTENFVVESKTYCMNDFINAASAVTKDNNEKIIIELNPLHTRIQQDLIKLRKLIKAKQRKSSDNISLKTPTSGRPSGEATSIEAAFDDQENNNIKIIRKASSLKKLKPLDCVKIAGYQMRTPALPKSDSVDSGVGSTSNSSSTCSQYPKQQQKKKTKRQNNNKTFNIYHSRVNPPPPSLPSDSLIYRASYLSRKKSNISSKMTQNIPSKQPLPIPIPSVSPVVKEKQPSFIKQETPLPPIRRLSDGENITATHYTYAASSSSAIPRSMILKRNTSLLPILLQSSSCMGFQPREAQPKKSNDDDLEEEQEENNNNNDDDDAYYYLLDYKHLINRLPKPVISTLPRRGQDDYGVLFEQLDHIRETMPDSNTYDDYARIV